jgi:hypothetical protein
VGGWEFFQKQKKRKSFILKRSLNKYNKINGITPMKTHVDFVRPKLFVRGKL